MDPTPIDYQPGDLIACLTTLDNPDSIRYVKIAMRDHIDGQAGYYGEVLAGPDDGARVWGYDHRIIWARSNADGAESFRWAGDIGDPHFEKFCHYWQLRWQWTRTGLELRVSDRWKPIAPGAVLTMGKPAT
jgi:hypothetical protein